MMLWSKKKGMSVLRSEREIFFAAIENDKINIFKGLKYGDRYRPVDKIKSYNYGGIIIDASNTGYIPSLFVKVLSPTEETVYAGVAGKSNISFAENLNDAKTILGSKGARTVYNTKSSSAAGTGVIVDLKSSDRIFFPQFRRIRIYLL